MRWELPWPKLAASGTGDEEKPDGWQRHVEALRQADPGNVQPVPVDLVTASGSGLDPHISLAAARIRFLTGAGNSLAPAA